MAGNSRFFVEDKIKANKHNKITCVKGNKIQGNYYDAVFNTKVFLEFFFFHILFWFLGPLANLIYIFMPNGIMIAKNLYFCS